MRNNFSGHILACFTAVMSPTTMLLKLPRSVVVCCLHHKDNSSKDNKVIKDDTELRLVVARDKVGALQRWRTPSGEI